MILPDLPRVPNSSSVEANSSTGVHLLRAILGNEPFHKLISTRLINVGQLVDIHTYNTQFISLFPNRLPVSNVHVVLGYYPSPSLSTSSLKVLLPIPHHTIFFLVLYTRINDPGSFLSQAHVAHIMSHKDRFPMFLLCLTIILG